MCVREQDGTILAGEGGGESCPRPGQGKGVFECWGDTGSPGLGLTVLGGPVLLEAPPPGGFLRLSAPSSDVKSGPFCAWAASGPRRAVFISRQHQ